MPQPTGEQAPAGTAPATATPAAPGAAATATPAAASAALDAGAPGAQGQLTQAAVDAIVARERKRAETEIAIVRSEFETKLAALTPATPAGTEADKNKPTPDAIAAARRPLEDVIAAEKIKLGTLEKNLVTTMVEAAANGTTAPKVAAMLADGLVRLKEDGTAEVVDAKGQPRYTASGPMTLAELVAEISAANDFLIPASVRNGASYKGTTPQSQQTVPEQIAQLESEGKFTEANRLKSRQLAAMKA